MRFITTINNQKCLEWELNATQGILVSLLYEANSWAKEVIIEDKVYYFVSRNLVISELPMFFDKPDTVYREFKKLAEKGIIEYKKHGKMDLIRLTEKGKKWNFLKSENNSEKNPSFEENSEKNPSKLGKKSENNSEKNPTYKDTNIHKDTNINNNNNNIYSEIVGKWNKIADEFNMSNVLKISDTRKKRLDRLLKKYTKEEIFTALSKIRQSDFLTGRSGKWKMTFDDFIEERKFLKLLEDGYKNNDYKQKENKNNNVYEVTAEGLQEYFGGL